MGGAGTREVLTEHQLLLLRDPDHSRGLPFIKEKHIFRDRKGGNDRNRCQVSLGWQAEDRKLFTDVFDVLGQDQSKANCWNEELLEERGEPCWDTVQGKTRGPLAVRAPCLLRSPKSHGSMTSPPVFSNPDTGVKKAEWRNISQSGSDERVWWVSKGWSVILALTAVTEVTEHAFQAGQGRK